MLILQKLYMYIGKDKANLDGQMIRTNEIYISLPNFIEYFMNMHPYSEQITWDYTKYIIIS